MTNTTTEQSGTDLRQERGRLLSKHAGIRHIAGVTWLVPSQTQASGGYLVNTSEGHLSSVEVKQKMQMEISAGGQSFTQDLTQDVSMKLAGESAAK